MEDFIAIAVMIVIGLVYDFVKSKTSDTGKKGKKGLSTQARAESHFRHPAAKPSAAVAAETKVAKPQERPRHTEYTPLFVEGERSTVDLQSDGPDSAQARGTEMSAREIEARKAHFERWRRAVVDAGIIAPKGF